MQCDIGGGVDYDQDQYDEWGGEENVDWYFRLFFVFVFFVVVGCFGGLVFLELFFVVEYLFFDVFGDFGLIQVEFVGQWQCVQYGERCDQLGDCGCEEKGWCDGVVGNFWCEFVGVQIVLELWFDGYEDQYEQQILVLGLDFVEIWMFVD